LFAIVFFLSGAQKRPIQLLPVIKRMKFVLIVVGTVEGSVSVKKVWYMFFYKIDTMSLHRVTLLV
jgi:hypothetical protein